MYHCEPKIVKNYSYRYLLDTSLIQLNTYQPMLNKTDFKSKVRIKLLETTFYKFLKIGSEKYIAQRLITAITFELCPKEKKNYLK